MKKLIFTISLILSSATSQAVTLYETKTVTRVFSEAETRAGFYTEEGLADCQWGIMFIDLSNEAGKGMLTLALSAKLSNTKIVRIDYTKPDARCFASGLHIQ